MNTFESEWNVWAAHCVAPDASTASRETLRCAFYSGAMTWERLLLRIRVSSNREEAATQIADLHDEMRAYVAELLSQYGPAGPGMNGATTMDVMKPDEPAEKPAYTMRCLACKRPYLPSRGIAPFAAGGTYPTPMTAFACECGSTAFEGSIPSA